MKYRKKPVVIEATRWFKEGNSAAVRVYRASEAERPCQHCSRSMHVHGWIDTLEGGHIVCPGDFIITGVKGEMYPCKPDIFEATYERAEDWGDAG